MNVINKIREMETGHKVAIACTVVVVSISLVVGYKSLSGKSSSIKADNVETSSDKKVTEVVRNYELETIEGYTTYDIKYTDELGRPIQMVSEPHYIRNGNTVYTELQQAKDAGMFGDYTDEKGVFKIQLKNDSTYAWKVTPLDERTIHNWNDSKAGVVLTINNDGETDNKVVKYTAIIDYNDDNITPTIDESVE